ncbi:hypothetical protein SALBM217S_08761 [Streptomyces griseoloalbus]
MNRRTFVAGAAAALTTAAVSSACTSPEPRPTPSASRTPSPRVPSPRGPSPTPRPATPADWTALAGHLDGRLVRPGDADWTTAHRLYNTRFDTLRPAAVAYVRHADDIRTALAHAREHAVPIAVRSGGHSYAGWSSGDGRLIVDVSGMNHVRVDGDTAVVGAGARLIDVYRTLTARGLTVPGGSCPTVGIAGLTLGGGHGVTSRAHGLTCDSLTEATVVTADGRRLTASDSEHPDLFWALRGAGNAQFGVVTEFRFRTRPAPSGVTGYLTWPWERAAAVVAAWQDWGPDQPDEIWSALHPREHQITRQQLVPGRMRTRVVLVVRHPGQLDPHRLVRGLRQTRAVEASSLVSGAVAAPEIGRAELLLCERDRPGGLPRGIHPPHGRGETLLQLPDALHIVLRLLVGRHTPVLDDRVRPRVVRGEHVGQIPAHVLHIGRERAVVRRRRRDRVLGSTRHGPVPVPVDAVRGPGAGDELRDALRRRMALRLGVRTTLRGRTRHESRRRHGPDPHPPAGGERRPVRRRAQKRAVVVAQPGHRRRRGGPPHRGHRLREPWRRGFRRGGADSPKAAATAPSGEKPVSAGAAGIPAGFAHDRRGAESAAANYAVALVSADILKPARRAEIVRQVFVADKQASLEGRFDTAYSKEFLSSIGLDENGNAAPGDTYVSRTMPIGTKVTSYSDADATVDVWCSGVFGTAGEKTTNPVTSDWFTMTLQLRWADGDWKVDSFAQKDGPAPVPGDDKASTAEEMAKAVQEYGGFTYAR